MSTELHKWARLFAAFAIIFGVAYSLLASAGPPPAASGFKADLLWPTILLGIGAAALAVTAISLQISHRHNRKETHGNESSFQPPE